MQHINRGILQFLTCLIFLMSQTACQKDNDIEIINPNPIDKDSEISTGTLALLSTAWGAPVTDVKKVQHKALILVEEDVDYLKYSNKQQTFIIAYSFTDGKLSTSLMLVPQKRPIVVDTYKLDEFNYIGNLDGVAVHSSSSSIAAVMNRDINGSNYLAVGLTPIDNTMNLFETVEPITVTTLPATDITTKSMILNATVSGFMESPSAYITYSLSADMSSPTTRKCTITDGKFSYTLTGLKANSTVYYYAYVTDEGINYEGQQESASVDAQKTYAVGDVYPSDSDIQGVVCRISNDGASGTILSLDEGFIYWDTRVVISFTNYSSYNTSNGSKNNMGNSTFAKWVNNHGPGWYGPARYQLIFSKSDLALINATLRSLKFPEMNGIYWSSTQYNSDLAWRVTVTETSYAGYNNQSAFYSSKDANNSVKAMKDF